MIPSSQFNTRPSRVSLCSCRKRKRRSQYEDGRPYIRKPPNAFWLFSKEQRPILKQRFGYSRGVTMLGEMVSVCSLAESPPFVFMCSEKTFKLRNQHSSSGGVYGCVLTVWGCVFAVEDDVQGRARQVLPGVIQAEEAPNQQYPDWVPNSVCTCVT